MSVHSWDKIIEAHEKDKRARAAMTELRTSMQRFVRKSDRETYIGVLKSLGKLDASVTNFQNDVTKAERVTRQLQKKQPRTTETANA